VPQKISLSDLADIVQVNIKKDDGIFFLNLEESKKKNLTFEISPSNLGRLVRFPFDDEKEF